MTVADALAMLPKAVSERTMVVPAVEGGDTADAA